MIQHQFVALTALLRRPITGRREGMWRLANPTEDDAIVTMCLALNADDPGPVPVAPEQVHRTLGRLRAEPTRGRAVVLQMGDDIAGYALLISSWSNELGGEVCNIDEIYVKPDARGNGHGSALFAQLLEDRALWPTAPVALALEVSPENTRARALYHRLGFQERNVTMQRRIDASEIALPPRCGKS
jgi:ribosomal protein S18 acetylase RimI-like enzyme